MRVPCEEKSGDAKDRFCEELEQVFDNFSMFHLGILLYNLCNSGEREYFQTDN